MPPPYGRCRCAAHQPLAGPQHPLLAAAPNGGHEHAAAMAQTRVLPQQCTSLPNARVREMCATLSTRTRTQQMLGVVPVPLPLRRRHMVFAAITSYSSITNTNTQHNTPTTTTTTFRIPSWAAIKCCKSMTVSRRTTHHTHTIYITIAHAAGVATTNHNTCTLAHCPMWRCACREHH